MQTFMRKVLSFFSFLAILFVPLSVHAAGDQSDRVKV